MQFLALAVYMPVKRIRPVWMGMCNGSVLVQVAMVQGGWHLWVDVIVMLVVVSMPVLMYGGFMLMHMGVLFEGQQGQGDNNDQCCDCLR